MISLSDSPDNTSGEVEFRLVPKPVNLMSAKKATQIDPIGDYSPYSCLISTLLSDEYEHNYGNTSFWIHFPEEIIRQAEGKTTKKALVFTNDNAGSKAGKFRDRENVVRVAQCLLPDSDVAVALLQSHLSNFGTGTWAESKPPAEMISPQKSAGAEQTQSGWECIEWFFVFACIRDSETGELVNCIIAETRCVQQIYIHEEDPGGGSGGGGIPSDEPGECDINGTEPCFDDGTGGSWGVPDPPDPRCTVVKPPVWCDPNRRCTSETSLLPGYDLPPSHIGLQELFEKLRDLSGIDTLPIGSRTEQGAWITYDPVTQRFGYEIFGDDWIKTPCGMDNDNISPPPNTISWVHIHPFNAGENTTSVCGPPPNGQLSFSSSISQDDMLTNNSISIKLGASPTITALIIDGINITSYMFAMQTIQPRCGF